MLPTRPRRLREARDRADVDVQHSILGTSALVAAAQFEDMSDPSTAAAAPTAAPPNTAPSATPASRAAASRDSRDSRDSRQARSRAPTADSQEHLAVDSHAHLQEFHKPYWELVNLENDYLQPYLNQYFPYTKNSDNI